MYQNNPYYQNYNMPQYQMNNHIDQNQMYAGGAQPFLKGKSVISIDEARAAQVDFDGSVFIFPDITNGCIYTKQATPNGIIFNKYILEEQNAKSASSDYVTREELNNIISELKSAIKSNLNTQSPAPAVELSYEQEELLADLLATYGEEIIDITDNLFDRLKERH